MAENRRHPQYTHPIHRICVKDIQGTLTRIKGQTKILNKPMPEQSLYQRESYACGKTRLRKYEGILCLVVRESKSNSRPSLTEAHGRCPQGLRRVPPQGTPFREQTKPKRSCWQRQAWLAIHGYTDCCLFLFRSRRRSETIPSRRWLKLNLERLFSKR